MREPLKISESEISAAVESYYRITTAALSFLPLGNDSATSVYRVKALDGATYFCKLRTANGFSLPSLAVPQFLHAQGVPHILAPLPTLNDTLWVMVNGFALTLYPFIENGRTAASGGMTDAQWREFGAVVRQYHTLPLPPELRASLAREQFVPKQRELIPVLEAVMERDAPTNDIARELHAIWHSQNAVIQTLVNRVEALGAQLRQAAAPMVLCHADMHTYNVLMDQANNFLLVDWDEVILALPERDLMFVDGGISRTLVTAQQTAQFWQGYDGPPPTAAALNYYRIAWAIQDLAAYGESALLLPDTSVEARQDAVQGVKRLFAPGEIVEIASVSGI